MPSPSPRWTCAASSAPNTNDKGHQLYWLRCPQDALGRPDLKAFAANNRFLFEAIGEGNVKSIRAVRHGGVLQAIYESALGNGIGVHIDQLADGFAPEYGGYLISSDGGLGIADNLQHLGFTTDSGNEILDVADMDLSRPLTLEDELNKITGVGRKTACSRAMRRRADSGARRRRGSD